MGFGGLALSTQREEEELNDLSVINLEQLHKKSQAALNVLAFKEKVVARTLEQFNILPVETINWIYQHCCTKQQQEQFKTLVYNKHAVYMATAPAQELIHVRKSRTIATQKLPYFFGDYSYFQEYIEKAAVRDVATMTIADLETVYPLLRNNDYKKEFVQRVHQTFEPYLRTASVSDLMTLQRTRSVSTYRLPYFFEYNLIQDFIIMAVMRSQHTMHVGDFNTVYQACSSTTHRQLLQNIVHQRFGHHFNDKTPQELLRLYQGTQRLPEDVPYFFDVKHLHFKHRIAQAEKATNTD
jgi:hypothetical protein